MPPSQEDELQLLFEDVKRRQRHPKGPQRISEVISRLLARRGYAREITAEVLEEAWRQAAGQSHAQQSRPGRIRRGVLEVLVSNSSVLQELTFQSSHIVRELHKRVPEFKIRELRYRIGEVD